VHAELRAVECRELFGAKKLEELSFNIQSDFLALLVEVVSS